ncbi:hypothetical protein GF374_00925 [Candidatus Woesearchaeota archaeon]|nr:hypothetical protein [Candidatus Woesearchaeota archaeon]
MSDNIITKKELGEITRNVLKYLDEKDVKDLGDLEIKTDAEINQEGITFQLRPSKLGTTAKVLSYLICSKGIPLEVRTNEALNYTKLIVKTSSDIPGYERFVRDSIGNLGQYKTINHINLSKVKSELKKLADYCVNDT